MNFALMASKLQKSMMSGLIWARLNRSRRCETVLNGHEHEEAMAQKYKVIKDGLALAQFKLAHNLTWKAKYSNSHWTFHLEKISHTIIATTNPSQDHAHFHFRHLHDFRCYFSHRSTFNKMALNSRSGEDSNSWKDGRRALLDDFCLCNSTAHYTSRPSQRWLPTLHMRESGPMRVRIFSLFLVSTFNYVSEAS